MRRCNSCQVDSQNLTANSQNQNYHTNQNTITKKKKQWTNEYTYEKIEDISIWLKTKIPVELIPKVGIVCGSGLGGLGDRLQKQSSTITIPYSTIPGFPRSTVAGHKGNLIFGFIKHVPVVCMQGRFHTYEGYSVSLCTMPMKVFKLLGVDTVVLTCAAGGINQTFSVGDIMLIRDHIAPMLWTLQNPLVGHNDDRFGPRFPATNKIYSKSHRDLFNAIAKEKNIVVKNGIHSSFGGPNYETVSELRCLASLGADSAGMSTTHEALVANYCGLKILALALITNKAVLEYDSEEFPNHLEVLEIAAKRAGVVENLVVDFVGKLYA